MRDHCKLGAVVPSRSINKRTARVRFSAKCVHLIARRVIFIYRGDGELISCQNEFVETRNNDFFNFYSSPFSGSI
jgi:hypothetical protein